MGERSGMTTTSPIFSRRGDNTACALNRGLISYPREGRPRTLDQKWNTEKKRSTNTNTHQLATTKGERKTNRNPTTLLNNAWAQDTMQYVKILKLKYVTIPSQSNSQPAELYLLPQDNTEMQVKLVTAAERPCYNSGSPTTIPI